MTPRRRWAGTALAALATTLALLLAGCGGGSDGPPAKTAAFVPRDALAFVHVSTDPNRDATKQTLAVLRRFPSLTDLPAQLERSLQRRQPGAATGVSYSRDIRPWLGDEAALALLPRPGAVAGTLVVLSVRDETGARQFLARLGAPTSREARHGVAINRYGAQAAAFDGGMLLAGDAVSVRAAIDAHAADGRTLAANKAYETSLDGAPDDRAVDLFATPGGVRRVLGGQGIGLGPLLALTGTVRGIGAALSGEGHQARLWLQVARPGGHDGGPTVDAASAVDVPAPVIAAVTAAGLDRTVKAAAVGRGLLAAPLRSIEAVLTASRVNVDRDLVPLLRQPTTLALLPRAGGTPAVLLLARTKNQGAARVALARLQAPLVQLLGPLSGSEGSAPTLAQTTIQGTTVFRVRISTSFEVDYALWDGHIAVATDLGAIAAARRGGRQLSDEAVYKAVRVKPDKSSTAVGFLDFGRLLALVEASGLAPDPRYRAIRPDLRRIVSLGARSKSGEGKSTAEITLSIR